jgi:hypothetical protein
MRDNLFARQIWLGSSVLLLLLLMVTPSKAQQEVMTITINSTESIDAVGNAQAHASVTFNPPQEYDLVRRLYLNLYVLFRDLGPTRSSYEIKRSSLKIVPDDAQRSINLSADVLGAAVSRGTRWQITLAPNEQLSMQDTTRISTIAQSSGQSASRITSINNYILPARAQNVRFDKETHLITYTLPKPVGAQGRPQVDVSVRYKERLMAAVYKVYADPQARDGAYWVAKTIVTNSGKTPIYDLKIYYRLGDYTDLSVPEPYSLVSAGGSAVDMYYPIIESKVAELKSITPVQLYIRYEYRDAAGRLYSAELTKHAEMLGINQFEFSNLNNEDRTDSWFDYFNNAPLLSAFVTRLDDPVKQFAGFVSQAAGGVPAASDDKSARVWLGMAYEMERRNDIVYSTPSDFLTQDRSSGQDIKYPRDVFRDKSGTCVDLAITYAALAEAVGLKANLMVVPGHTFPIIRLPSGAVLPVESTGLGGGNQRMNFEQAVETGREELQKYLSKGVYYLVNVEEEWNTDRVPNPELAQLGTDFLDKSGIHRVSDFSDDSVSAHSGRQDKTDLANSVGPAQAPGMAYLVVHDHGLGTLAYFCVGVLYVSGDTIVFRANTANDGRMDQFEIKKSDIKEARKNKMPMGQNGQYFEGFHIRLQNGVNFNFARIDQQGRSLSSDEILMSLMP